MAGNQLAVIRNNQVYMGWSKQANWGTPLAPTSYWRWLGGSEAAPDARIQSEREGDTDVYETLIYKQGEWWGVKIVEYVRPITAGCAIQAVLGSGSDTLTAATKSSTLSGAVAAGATSFSSATDLTNVGTAYLAFTPGYSSAVAEVRNVNLASKTGTGPYTYNLVAGEAFLFAHLSADVIRSASTHTFARTVSAYDPYTLEVGYGASGVAPFDAFRIQDSVAYQLDIEWETGRPIKMTHMWYGIKAQRMGALLAPAFEGTGLVQNGACGRPLLMYDAGSSWKLAGANSGNATTITRGKLTIKNSTAAEDLQNEGIAPSYFIPGNIEISGELEAHFTSWNQYYETYFGSTAPAANATDSYLTGNESFAVTFASDGINSLALSLPSITYMAAKLAPPNLDSKVLRQPISFKAQKTPANPVPLSIVLSNTQNTAY